MTEYKENCTDYDWELYFRIANLIVPNILANARKEGIQFAVKGGKAVDAYLKNPIGSPDWDIIVHDFEPLFSFLTERLTKIPSIRKSVTFDDVTLEIKNKKYPGKQIGITNCGGMWVIDIIKMSGKDLRSTVINGIPYINLKDLIFDLEDTIKDRTLRSSQQELFGLSDTETIKKRQKENAQNIEIEMSKLRENIAKIIDGSVPDKEKATRVVNRRLDNLETLYENNRHLHSYETYEKIFESRHNVEHFKTKLKRTQARLTTLLSAIHNNIEISPEYLTEICNFCTEHPTASLNLTGKEPTYCNKIVPHC